SRARAPQDPRAAMERRALAERGPEPGLAHPPEVDLHSVDEGYRDLVPVLPHVIGRRRDVAFLPADAEVGSHSFDHGPCVVAEVTARAAEQCDPCHASRHKAGPTESAAGRAAARRSAPGRRATGRTRAGRTRAGHTRAGRTRVRHIQARHIPVARIAAGRTAAGQDVAGRNAAGGAGATAGPAAAPGPPARPAAVLPGAVRRVPAQAAAGRAAARPLRT